MEGGELANGVKCGTVKTVLAHRRVYVLDLLAKLFKRLKAFPRLK